MDGWIWEHETRHAVHTYVAYHSFPCYSEWDTNRTEWAGFRPSSILDMVVVGCLCHFPHLPVPLCYPRRAWEARVAIDKVRSLDQKTRGYWLAGWLVGSVMNSNTNGPR